MRQETHMGSERADDVLLTRYLLGRLSEREAIEVEDRAFSDAAYLGSLQAAEADLIDAWVNGELSEPDSRVFEQRFLTSPERRRKVEFARDLARIAAESKIVERFAPRVFGWSSAVAWAAVLVCMIGAGWLISQNASLRSRVAAVESQQSAIESREQELRRRLTDEQRRADDLSAQLQRQPLGRETSPIASLMLIPGVTRGEQRTQQFVLQPSAQLVRISIELEPRHDSSRFRAELSTHSGVEVLTSGNLLRSGDTVSFDVPASALATGDYELALKGVAADESITDLGYFYFRVQKR
jgi:anti-sigma factor RsiW